MCEIYHLVNLVNINQSNKCNHKQMSFYLAFLYGTLITKNISSIIFNDLLFIHYIKDKMARGESHKITPYQYKISKHKAIYQIYLDAVTSQINQSML